MLKVRDNLLISIQKEKLTILLGYGLLSLYVLFVTVQTTRFAFFLAIIIGLMPILHRRFFTLNTYLFLLILSLILEKYSYYVGFSIRLPMLLITGTLLILLLKNLTKGHFEIAYNRFHLILVLLFLNYSLGAIWSINPVRVIRVSILYVFLFSLFFITIHLIDSKERIDKALKYTVIVGIIGASYGFYQIIAFVYDLPSQLPFTEHLRYKEYYNSGMTAFKIGNNWFPRINSTFNDPVLIGCFAGMSLMILCSLFYIRHTQNALSRNKKLFFVICFLMLFACVILTFSRSSWLGLACGFFVLGFFLWKHKKTRKSLFRFSTILFVMMLILVLAYPPFKEMIVGRVVQTFDSSHISTAGHWKWLRVAIEAWSENPLFGVGLNNYPEFYARNYQATTLAMTHSAYFSFLAETGVIGFFLEMTFIFIIFRHLLLAVSHSQKLQNDYYYFILVGLLSAYFVILAANMTYHFYTQFYVWFFNGLAIAVSSYVLNEKPPKHT